MPLSQRPREHGEQIPLEQDEKRQAQSGQGGMRQGVARQRPPRSTAKAPITPALAPSKLTPAEYHQQVVIEANKLKERFDHNERLSASTASPAASSIARRPP
jgi:hypothetical protein